MTIKKARLVYGIGVNDADYPINVNGEIIPAYRQWNGMLKRCYYANSQKQFPTYIGCSVADEWLVFSSFRKWFDSVKGEYMLSIGYQLDKDLIYPGNKIYSPNTCVFVPGYINSLLNNRSAVRDEHPLGVSYDRRQVSQRNPYQARCNDSNKNPIRTTHPTPAEAHWKWCRTKADVIELQTDRYRVEATAHGCYDLRVADALLMHACRLRYAAENGYEFLDFKTHEWPDKPLTKTKKTPSGSFC